MKMIVYASNPAVFSYLFSHNVKLPKWGFEQQEVTCGTGVLKRNTMWRVEANEHPDCELLFGLAGAIELS
jgi:dolichyl-phosphate-mannose--protein O-mannosyl transferase